MRLKYIENVSYKTRYCLYNYTLRKTIIQEYGDNEPEVQPVDLKNYHRLSSKMNWTTILSLLIPLLECN